MLSLHKSLKHAFRPVSISLQIFGLQPFYINKNGELRVSYWRICVTIFYFVTSAIAIYYSSLIDVDNEKRMNGSKVIKIISSMYIPGSMFLMSVTYIYRFIRIKNDKILVTEILNIMQLLENLGMSGTIEIKLKSTFRYILNLVLIVVFSYLIFDILFTEFLQAPRYGYFIVLITYWPFLIAYTVMSNNQILIVSWLILIQKIYLVINVASNKILDRRVRNDTDLVNSVNVLLEVHKKLRKCVDNFEQLYSFQLFIFIVFHYLTLLSHGYFILCYTVFEVHANDKYFTFAFFIKFSVHSIFHLLFITTHVVAIVNQVSKHAFLI